MKKVGIVLGRFQPPHQGHLNLFKKVLEENDELLVIIGSSQKADPLTAQEREGRIVSFLKDFKNYKILQLADPQEKESWPMYLKNASGLDGTTLNTFYRADNDPITEHMGQLESLGFRLKIVPREKFEYVFMGKSYLVSSASEIKALVKGLL